MAEKRQIQFERYTNLPLGGNWAGEWPAYVLVHHEGAVGAGAGLGGGRGCALRRDARGLIPARRVPDGGLREETL